MITLFLICSILIRTLPEYIDNASLYWVMNSVLFFGVSVYMFHKSKKTICNLLVCFALCIMFLNDLVINLSYLITPESNIDYFKTVLLVVMSLLSWVVIFRKRYDWRALKSEEYNKKKVQAIYSRPNSFITLLGATTSLSPKCSVRYSFNGKTVRFSRTSDTPLISDTRISSTDIIEETEYTGDYFTKRCEHIKNKKYNLVTFNCKNLM